MPTISIKVLREQLRQLAADQLIARRQLAPKVKGVQYSLTPHGRSLDPVFSILGEWGIGHLRRSGPEATRIHSPAPPAAR
jgi:DNA-binding HxlR family transcriptional regulator